MLNRFLIVFFISSNIFSQTQVVIVEEMLMDVPFAGEIKYTTTKYASDNLFKRDMEIEVGSFLVRMAMGGNKKLGEFIDGNKKMRTVYDLNEEEYAQENFQTIIDNDGKPTLEIPLGGPMGGGDGGNAQTFPRSFSESMLRRAGHEFESVEGRVVKYQMSPIDDDGFKMGFEIKINKQPFKKSDFSIPTKWKKVDELN